MRFIGVVVALILALAGCAEAEESSPTPARAFAPPGPSPTPESTGEPTRAPTATPIAMPTAVPSPAAVPGTYLALGDSLAVGVGATRPAATGYVARLYAALSAEDATPRVATLQNLAVSGETSTSMVRSGQLAAALELIAAADPPVTLVTLDIGGNDLLRLLRTDACAENPEGAPCLQLLALTLDDFEATYRQIVEELAAALDEPGPDVTLAVMTYFNPFSGTDAAHETAAELALLGTDGGIDCDGRSREARGMNDVIFCLGEELGAVGVDVHPPFVGLGLELTHMGTQDIHANDLGYQVIADEFVRALHVNH